MEVEPQREVHVARQERAARAFLSGSLTPQWDWSVRVSQLLHHFAGFNLVSIDGPYYANSPYRVQCK